MKIQLTHASRVPWPPVDGKKALKSNSKEAEYFFEQPKEAGFEMLCGQILDSKYPKNLFLFFYFLH